MLQSESGLATPLFPQSSVKINLTKNPFLAFEHLSSISEFMKAFSTFNSSKAKMTFLCLIEIRFCFNGFAATFVFGGLLIIRLVGEAQALLVALGRL